MRLAGDGGAMGGEAVTAAGAAREPAPRPGVTRLAGALCALSMGLAAASVPLAAVNGEDLAELVTNHHAIGILDALVLPPIGGLIVAGDRRHLLAWLLLANSLTLAAYNFSEQYAPLALGLTPARLSLPGGELASWLTSWTNVPGIVIAVVFLVLLFPDGRLPSRRWWPLGLAGALALVVPTVVLAVGTWPLRGPELITHEDELPALVETVFWTAFGAALVLGAISVVALVLRFRQPGRCSASRSSGSPMAPPPASPSACSPRPAQARPSAPTSSSWGRPCSWPGGHRHLPVPAVGQRPADQPHPGLRAAHRPARRRLRGLVLALGLLPFGIGGRTPNDAAGDGLAVAAPVVPGTVYRRLGRAAHRTWLTTR